MSNFDVLGRAINDERAMNSEWKRHLNACKKSGKVTGVDFVEKQRSGGSYFAKCLNFFSGNCIDLLRRQE